MLPGIAVKGQPAVEVGIVGAALEWDGLLSVDCQLVRHLRDTLHIAGMETGQPIRLAALLKLCFATKVMKSLQWLVPQLIHYCGTLMDGRLKGLGFDTTPPCNSCQGSWQGQGARPGHSGGGPLGSSVHCEQGLLEGQVHLWIQVRFCCWPCQVLSGWQEVVPWL